MKRLIDHIYHFRDHTISDIWHVVCVATTKYYLDRIFDKPQQKKGWTIMLALKMYLIMKLSFYFKLEKFTKFIFWRQLCISFYLKTNN